MCICKRTVFDKKKDQPAAAAAKLLQSCSTLCDPRDGSLPGSLIPGILQARTLEWVAISFSNAWKWKVKVKLLSRVWLLATPWTAAYQALLSMEFARQEYWSGVPLPSPKDQPRIPLFDIFFSQFRIKPYLPYAVTWVTYLLFLYLKIVWSKRMCTLRKFKRSSTESVSSSWLKHLS